MFSNMFRAALCIILGLVMKDASTGKGFISPEIPHVVNQVLWAF